MPPTPHAISCPPWLTPQTPPRLTLVLPPPAAPQFISSSGVEELDVHPGGTDARVQETLATDFTLLKKLAASRPNMRITLGGRVVVTADYPPDPTPSKAGGGRA